MRWRALLLLRRLLLLLNPAGGARRARRVYKSVVAPVFAAAGISVALHETQWAGHARSIVEGLRVEELACYDGIVALGGDGLFHEVLNGVIALRLGA